MKGRDACSALAIIALFGSGTALAQPSQPDRPAATGAAETPASSDVDRGAPPAAKVVAVRFFEDPQSGAAIEPIMRVAGGVNQQFRSNTGQAAGADDYEDRITTTALVQFGVKGQIVEGLTFYSEFERNVGNYGTSVWSGSAALQSRANYVRYERHGASVAAGIITDPASDEFVSQHVLDMLGRDYTVAAPAYWSGVVLSQGILAQYRLMAGLELGVSFSSANPLATSLSYGFGGNVADIGDIYHLPAKTIALGEPGSSARLTTISPGIVFKRKLRSMKLDVRATWQQYFVNIDTDTTNDQELGGYNLHAALKLSFLDGRLSAFGSGSYRKNEMVRQAAPIDISTLDPDNYEAVVVSGGLDYNIRNQDGIGVYYGMVEKDSGGGRPVMKEHYLNVGGTYWLAPERMAVGARYAKLLTTANGYKADGQVDYDSYFVTLRMLLD